MLRIAVLGDDRPADANVTALFLFAYVRIERLPEGQERRSQRWRKADASRVLKLDMVVLVLKRPSGLAVCGMVVSQVGVPVSHGAVVPAYQDLILCEVGERIGERARRL